ncbi:MAG: amidinotransferase, partial [Gammaproteobacteria bacterium]|nr:amidinotransferase [Gammaproteobacteria bacterium]
MKEPQSASAVMMIRPAQVPANPLTAETNAFQQKMTAPAAQLFERARAEFDSLEAELRKAGVSVCVFDGAPEGNNPDAIFPNNWITTHADGSVALYPMLVVNRRSERRRRLIMALAADHGFLVREIVDFSPYEEQGLILEGTGSMVLDRVNGVAYACLSARTDARLLDEFCLRFDYEPFVFVAVDRKGKPIYHTNVMMTLGTGFAVICLESIIDIERRAELVKALEKSGHDIIDISFDQMGNFAGNMLELDNGQELLVAMSRRAYECLDEEQRTRLQSHARPVFAPIDTIEDCSGG